MPEATIASFILRFTQEHNTEGVSVTSPWRGVIRHVQTNEEVRFTQIEDALAFVSQFVDIDGNGARSEDLSFPEKGEL